MNFDYTLVENKLELKDLKNLQSYVSDHGKEILKELDRLNQLIALIPIKVVYKDDKSYLGDVYQSFGFTGENNGKIIVQLIK